MTLPIRALVAVATLLAAGASPASPEAAVDALFADYASPGQPGCAVGAIRDGEFVLEKGYGLANLEYGLPITPRSVFRIGSTSKQFTAAAVALLAQDGALGLDDPVRRHFPEFPAWADEMTVADLVHHTSGIRDYLELASLAGLGGDADHYDDAWVLDLLARQATTNFPPGTQHLYSNSGYLLMAHLVRRVSGKTLREFAAERIFGPLGMADTHFHDDYTEVVSRRASGYARRGEDGWRISQTTLDMVGDGGVFTTVEDLAAWDANFYDNRLGGGSAFIETLLTPGRLPDGSDTGYAFGLGVGTYRGLKRVEHGGAFVGYRAQMVRFPERRLTVIQLCNRADADLSLATKAAEAWLGDALAPVPASAAPEARNLDASSPTLYPENLQRFEGDFWEPDERFVAETRVIDGELWAVHSRQRKNLMKPIPPHTDHRFAMLDVPADVVVEFDVEEGRVVGMRRFINGQPRGEFTPFERRTLSAAEREAYTGCFHGPELGVDYVLSGADDGLRFSIDGRGEHELTAMFGEVFENADYGAFEFARDGAGRVTGFTLDSGRVRGLAFSRCEG